MLRILVKRTVFSFPGRSSCETDRIHFMRVLDGQHVSVCPGECHNQQKVVDQAGAAVPNAAVSITKWKLSGSLPRFCSVLTDGGIQQG
jgi:hypothetical protein